MTKKDSHSFNAHRSKTPRWVFLFWGLVSALFLAFVILHLMGGGLTHHMH